MTRRCRSHARLYQPGCSAVRAYCRLLRSKFGYRLHQPQCEMASRRQYRQIHRNATINLCLHIIRSPDYPYIVPCMNLLHHRPRLYQPSQNHQRDVTDTFVVGGTLRIREHHGPSRRSPRGSTTPAMVHRGGGSPSLNIEGSPGQCGAEVLQTSAPMLVLAWWQAGSCDMPLKRPYN